jgi:hypothetical protein
MPALPLPASRCGPVGPPARLTAPSSPPRTAVSRVSPQRESRQKASHVPKASIRGRFRAAAARTSTIRVRAAAAAESLGLGSAAAAAAASAAAGSLGGAVEDACLATASEVRPGATKSTASRARCGLAPLYFGEWSEKA